MPHGARIFLDFSRPKTLRLRSSSQFLYVKNRGRTAAGAYFRISAAKCPGEELCRNRISDPCTASLPDSDTTQQHLESESRVGIVTTRKIGNAVVRARCRRQIRELHRLSRRLLLPGFWIVVIARPECATAPWKNLETEWLRLLGKLSILRTA